MKITARQLRRLIIEAISQSSTGNWNDSNIATLGASLHSMDPSLTGRTGGIGERIAHIGLGASGNLNTIKVTNFPYADVFTGDLKNVLSVHGSESAHFYSVKATGAITQDEGYRDPFMVSKIKFNSLYQMLNSGGTKGLKEEIELQFSKIQLQNPFTNKINLPLKIWIGAIGINVDPRADFISDWDINPEKGIPHINIYEFTAHPFDIEQVEDGAGGYRLEVPLLEDIVMSSRLSPPAQWSANTHVVYIQPHENIKVRMSALSEIDNELSHIRDVEKLVQIKDFIRRLT